MARYKAVKVGEKIAKKLLLPISAVANIISKYKETGSFETGKSPGRTPQISDRDMRSLTKIAKENRCPNLRDLDWTAEQWGMVIFSDESKFDACIGDMRKRVIRKSNETYHKDCMKRTVKSPDSVMI
ncbi:hypothetical protein ILUMI_21619 [Ignelater luminosus]|uniref:Paired domain-containing protein n=1 Tax=Ignelater luminosus TaxID=2038154 RepID=A0A8K0CE84_IGNLU|nr:hypothetical protein ILUMI_21619 [Ignelater luminosus]